MTVRLHFLADTFLKQTTGQSSNLPDSQKQKIPQGTTLVLLAYQTGQPGNHIKITLKDIAFKGFNTWYAYAEQVKIVMSPPYPLDPYVTALIPNSWNNFIGSDGETINNEPESENLESGITTPA
jgi:hypothetical protein